VPHIAILAHRSEPFEQIPYYLRGIAGIWREKGLKVSVCHGPERAVPADLAVLHVDLTVVPAEYLALAARYPVCLNRHAADISKRTISRNLVRLCDGCEGPVIVKANRNCGGVKEAELAARGGLTGSSPSAFQDYQVFESAALVPPPVWHDRELVVERFLPERQDGLYCLRMWYFLGDREFGQRNFSENPIVKSASTVRRERLMDVPDELRQMRAELGFDFGKFDYAMVDGRVVLYDVNKTPCTGAGVMAQSEERYRSLAEGIWRYL
jgi:hypothetical protein